MALLSDEFSSSASLFNWQRRYSTEAPLVSSLERREIDAAGAITNVDLAMLQANMDALAADSAVFSAASAAAVPEPAGVSLLAIALVDTLTAAAKSKAAAGRLRRPATRT